MKNKVNFYCDFNVDLIIRVLFSKHKIESNPYIYSPLRIQFKTLNKDEDSICIIWFSLEAFKNSYLNFTTENAINNPENIEEMISDYFKEIILLSEKFKKIILFSFVPFKKFNKNPLKTFTEKGDSYIATKINSFLADRIIYKKDIHLIDTQNIINNFSDAYDIKNWYLTKNPFNLGFNKEVANKIDLILKLLSNNRKIKIILLDLDNTIWGGEAGEMEINKIRLGGHDHIGESFSDFQKSLLSLNKEGILIALVSKNEESIAMNIFDNHPDMILKRKNIAKKSINWGPKFLNIVSIMKDLNLGLDSALFIDDNPIERESIRINLPEVNILELPKDPSSYAQTLESLDLLYSMDITKEDEIRTASYKHNNERFKMKSISKNKSSWLQKLDTKIMINEISELNFNRYVQLLNKTNQFNARTRRKTNAEFKDWLSLNDNKALTIKLEDKFGDLGIIGLLGYNKNNDRIFVEDFVLSCRAAGRSIEDLMIYILYEKAISESIEEIIIEASETKKNKPIIDFLKKNSFLEEKGFLSFGVNIKKTEIKKPKYISIKYE